MSLEIYPLGDNAITIDYGNFIDEDINKLVIARCRQLAEAPLPGMLEAVPAYNSFTIYYDPITFVGKTGDETIYDRFKKLTEEWLKKPVNSSKNDEDTVTIPVFYDGKDIDHISRITGLNKEKIIELHSQRIYRVFMLGFLPGFPYLGTLDEHLVMPRKPEPEAVTAGSVAIAGKQTGVYPMNSPGGWWVLGRTPIKLFDPSIDDPFLLRAGNMVKFFPISSEQFDEQNK